MSFQTYTAKLVQKQSAQPDIYILLLEISGGKRVEFIAGQYLVLHVPLQSGEYARRLYSIASPPHEQLIELVVKRVPNGVATKYVDAMKVGDMVEFQAPAGLFTLKDGGRDIVMIATNTGIVPFRSIVMDSVEKGPLTHDIHLYWGMRHFEDMYYFQQFDELSKKEPKFHFTPCLSRDEVARDRFINERIDRALIPSILPQFMPYERYDFYICGSVTVIDTIRNMLLEQGLKKQQIHFEKFT